MLNDDVMPMNVMINSVSAVGVYLEVECMC